MAAGAAIGLVAVLGIYYDELTTVQRDYFLERRGAVAEVSRQPQEPASGERVLQDVTLVSSSGLRVDMRVLRPAESPGDKLPTVLLVNGKRTGKYAVDLLDRPGNVAFAAIEYPYHGPPHVQGLWQTLAAVPAIQRAVLDTPPALMLAVQWLATQPWADPRQIELAGISLGVPFAAAAGAIEEQISRVWLVHGGASNLPWAELHLQSKIEQATIRRLIARLTLLLIYSASFDTLAWIEEIAPRPVIVVSARHDESVPQGFALADAADAGSADVIWTEGPHIRSSREQELQKLFDIFRSRVENDR